MRPSHSHLSQYPVLLIHHQPCGTGALDGKLDRAENFKKVLEVFFGDTIPQVTPSSDASTNGSSSGSVSSGGSDSSSSGSGTSSSGSGGSGTTTDRWYPDYNPTFSAGKCLNEAPMPGGRPSYDTGLECCNKAYANQASGECLSSLPKDPSLTISDTSPPGSQASGSVSLFETPGPTRQPVSPSSEAGMILSSQTFMDQYHSSLG